MITVVKADGSYCHVEKRDVLKQHGDMLTFCQKSVGGCIEFAPVAMSQDMQVVVNESGLLHDLEQNEFASMVCQQRIVGDVVVLTEKDLLD
jgi:hypothetical protein